MNLTDAERTAIRRSLQVARAAHEHEIRNWEYGNSEMLEHLKGEVKQWSQLLAKIDAEQPIGQ